MPAITAWSSDMDREQLDRLLRIEQTIVAIWDEMPGKAPDEADQALQQLARLEWERQVLIGVEPHRPWPARM
jgi:hypothetical protein